MTFRTLVAASLALFLAACAGLGLREPVKVYVAGIEPLPGQGMEARFALKLRLQNPNDAAIDFDGVAVDLDLRGMSFASGVSDQRGTVPRFGETVIVVPVTVPATAIIRQAFGFASDKGGKIEYRLRGRLGGLAGARFESRGDLAPPARARDESP